MPADSELWLPPLPPKAQKKVNRRQKYQGLVKWTGFPKKTLWDWLQLLSVLAIPVVIAAGSIWFSIQQSQTSLEVSVRSHQADQIQALEEQRNTVLKTYIDDMRDLMLNHGLIQAKEDNPVLRVARAETFFALDHLDAIRQGKLVRFLFDSQLITQFTFSDQPIVNLYDADLSGINLHDATLCDPMTRVSTDLNFTNMSKANLSSTCLAYAYLMDVDLSGADLRGAYLYGADLLDADLSRANLSGADLSHAILGFAKVSQEQLEQAKSLKGAIMPNGSIHP
jgi:hypothetical protein